MLSVIYKQIYETDENGVKEWVLIIYDISANHYVGVPVYKTEKSGCLYCKSIDKYVDVTKVADYNRSKMSKCVYIKGEPLKVSGKDYSSILSSCKTHLLSFLNNNIKSDVDGLNYIKWCRDKYVINDNELDVNNLKQNAIYWVNFGVGVGSELRKLRPAILWKHTGDKNLWTMIPLTTKKRKDKYYFHCDLECLAEGTAKIENMMNLSPKRILAPYFSKDKLAIITNNDYSKIKNAISKYYLFGEN